MTPLADDAAEVINGERDASMFLTVVSGVCTTGDQLYEALRAPLWASAVAAGSRIHAQGAACAGGPSTGARIEVARTESSGSSWRFLPRDHQEREYANLSHAARTLLVLIATQYTSRNNGRLVCCQKFLRNFAWSSAEATSRCIKQLMESRLLVRTRLGRRPNVAVGTPCPGARWTCPTRLTTPSSSRLILGTGLPSTALRLLRNPD